MIYTVTLNPAIDYVLHLDSLEKGEILRSQSQTLLYGGKGINVSLVLSELDVPSVATGFTAGFTGAALEQGIQSSNIKSDFVRLKDGLTRINVKLRAKEETDVNASGPHISKDDLKALLCKLEGASKNDFVVLAGSIPKSLGDDTYSIIIQHLDGKGINFAVDAQSNLLLNSLACKPFLIKPNNEELCEIFGSPVENHEKAVMYAKKLREMGARNVIVSMGHMGAVLVDEFNKEHFAKAHLGNAVNTVGAGDSMVAGFIAGYIKSGDYEYALKLGTACGAASAFSEGLATKKKISMLMEL